MLTATFSLPLSSCFSFAFGLLPVCFPPFIYAVAGRALPNTLSEYGLDLGCRCSQSLLFLLLFFAVFFTFVQEA